MKPLIIAMTLATACAAWWFYDTFECWWEPGTDMCVGCLDDCLDPLTLDTTPKEVS